MSKEKVIYYENELEDEFSDSNITPRKIDGSYDYRGGIGRFFGRSVLYDVFAFPIAYTFLKLKYHHRIVNKECLKKAKSTGFFLYGNHTNAIADAMMPMRLCYPNSAYVIVHPDNVSMPFLGKLTPSLGAIPLPDDKDAMRNFSEILEHHVKKKRCIAIYPEAHIWPYYTKIREFKDNSFRYPVQFDVPVYCFTNTYQRRKYGKTPRLVTYVEGPFYADKTLPIRRQREQLRNQVLETMKKYAKHSNVEVIQYRKKEE
ncbi:MAG: hypothetical protein IJ326_01330 [Lachnospiraceae bacterium]|nr:hypothetical protein [Lachnospiraceae bacterium]